jgi:predicted Zn-dependent peptidase
VKPAVRALPALAAALAVLACRSVPAPRPAEPQAPAAEATPAPAAPSAQAEEPAAPDVDRTRPPPLGPSPQLTLPAERHFSLANGLKVRLVEQHRLPIVALDLVVDAGAARDPAGLAGIATFTADMVTEGTRSRTATQISDQVGFLGASLDAGAGPDSATLAGGCLSDKLPAFLELFADVAQHPVFPRADFERVQDERRVTLLQQLDQPRILAQRAFIPVFWGKHPYGHTLLGTEATLARTRRQDLQAFHDRYWVPANAELVVVGDVTEGQLRPLLEKALGAWTRGRAAPPLTPQGPVAPHRALLIDKPGASQSYVFLGAPGLDRRSDDYVAASVLFQVLGGGMNSRLFRTLREEKGYTYGMGAFPDARRLAGASVVGGSVKSEVTGAALKDLFLELGKLRDEPVPGDELDEAKQAIVRGLPSDFATLGQTAGQLATLVVHGLPDGYWNTYAQAVQQITAADVQRVAQKYLDPERMTLVMVGARSVVAPQLGAVPLGPLQVERISTPLLPRKPARPKAPPTGAGAGAPGQDVVH